MTMQELINTNLPLNRKERFYTGTVFPFIVCKDNFRHINLLFNLLSDDKIPPITSTNEFTNIQFYTEYSLKESLYGTGRVFDDLPKTKDTPDIVFLIDGIPKTLIAFEAKMYDTPSRDELAKQMDAQKEILIAIKKNLGINLCHHFALLPEKFVKRLGKVDFKILTWESILDKFKHVCGNDYFYSLLSIAIEDYDKLTASEVTFGKNNEGYLNGATIYAQFKKNELEVSWMGRAGGFHGHKLQEDISSGKWRTQNYETRATHPPGSGKNWFLIQDFIKLVE